MERRKLFGLLSSISISLSAVTATGLIYDFVTLTPQEREQKKLNYQKFEAEKAAAKKPVTPASSAEVKPKVDTPPPSSETPGENKVS
jgi:hypothetical protein